MSASEVAVPPVRTAGDGTELVLVGGGTFLAGRDRTPESLPPFYAAVHPVTNAQWAAFVADTGYEPPSSDPEIASYLAHWPHGSNKSLPAELADHPVVHISAHDAQAYLDHYGLRLPKPLEWEKAARGVDGRTYPWGEMSPFGGWRTGKLCHVRAQTTAAVGTYAHVRTAWGCQDMVGNVSEICVAEETLGTEVLLCGSAFLRRQDHQGRMTCAHRRRLRAHGRNRWVGFRAFATP